MQRRGDSVVAMSGMEVFGTHSSIPEAITVVGTGVVTPSIASAGDTRLDRDNELLIAALRCLKFFDSVWRQALY